MLEANMFRTVMTALGLGVAGVIIACVLTVPLVPVTPSQVTNYNRIMENPVPNDTRDLTVYQAFQFWLHGTIRGNTQKF